LKNSWGQDGRNVENRIKLKNVGYKRKQMKVGREEYRTVQEI